MKIQKLLLSIMIFASCQSTILSCRVYSGKEITGHNLVYTSANLISDSEESTVINLYGNLTTINGYTIDLQYNIYSSMISLCNKTDNSILKINSNSDAWLCFDDFYMLACNQLWELVINCGTFVEVHRPFDPQVLISLDFEDVSWILDQNGMKVINMDLEGLCAGMYHLWFVYYSRMGKFLKGVDTIYITYPSCKC